METMFVIATKGRNNKEIYLAVDESKNTDKVIFKWVDTPDDAYMTFSYSDIEETAKHYFKNFNKWYITTCKVDFK